MKFSGDHALTGKNDQEVIVRNVVGLAEDLHLKDGL